MGDAELARALPEGAKELAWLEDAGASMGLCEIAGLCFVYGLTSTGEDPHAVMRLVKRAEAKAMEMGYRSYMAEVQTADMRRCAETLGFIYRSTLYEKKL